MYDLFPAAGSHPFVTQLAEGDHVDRWVGMYWQEGRMRALRDRRLVVREP